MLIDFRVENFCCFKDTAELSMQAAPITEHRVFNTFNVEKLDLLKSAVIYGANASGKSRLILGMYFLRNMVRQSAKESTANEKLSVESFRLNTETVNKPASFEIRFIADHVLYHYGLHATPERIVKEWLYSRKRPTAREAELFVRDKDDIQTGPQFKEGRKIVSLTRPNAAFLSVAAQFNIDTAIQISKWFENFNFISGLYNNYEYFTVKKISSDSNFKNRILKILEMADVGIKDISLRRTPLTIDQLPEELGRKIKPIRNTADDDTDKIFQVEVVTSHFQFDKDNQKKELVNFRLQGQESEGTQKLFALAGPILDTLDNGKILVIDEFESQLHPQLQKLVIDMFHSPRYNKKNAQLIVATHNTRLLSEDMFRRDQIWFVEKNQYGASELYSLYDFKNGGKIRKDESFEKNYILGKYGAVPNVVEMDLEE
ncbi:ATP-binding protein [candidate division KSB1 bacterium]|nr:ATP-binding protein [candidate division KSB1 bacterium]